MAHAKQKTRGRPPGTRVRYREIAAVLEARIRKGVWQPGAVLPSHAELAREFGVAEYTVRLALGVLRSDGYLQTTARRRLAAAIPETSCSAAANVVAEVLTSSLMRGHRSKSFRAMQAGIEIGIGELDLPLYIVHGLLVRDNLPQYLLDMPLRGILLVGNQQPATLRRYAKLNVPVVVVDSPPRGQAVHSLTADNRASAAEAARRITGLGHRRLAFVRLVKHRIGVDPDGQERQDGFLEATHGLKPAPRVVNCFSRDKAGDPALLKLLRAAPRVTAVLASDGGVARKVEETARMLGLRVPKDLSIVCWNSTVDQSPFDGPCTDFEELGRQAVHLLRLPRRPAEQRRFPCTWREGKTLAPPPGARPL